MNGDVHLVGVRLRAGGAWPFLGIPLREFTDQVVELEAIMAARLKICATRFVKRGMTIRDLICWSRGLSAARDLERNRRGRSVMPYA